MQINNVVVTRLSDLIPTQPIPKEDLTSPPFPLNHARILYNNILFSSTVTATNGSNRISSIKPNTYERFTFSGETQVYYSIPTNQNVDTICIGAHNLIGATVRVYYDKDDSGMLRHLGSQVATGEDMMFHFDTIYSAKRISVKVETTEPNNYIGYISAGVALQLQRPFFGGHSPINDSDESSIEFARTQAGEIISSQLMKRGKQTDVTVNNLNDAWFNQYIPAFRVSAKTLPFFFAWNLLEYPNDVGLCRLSQDIQDGYSNTLNLHNLSFTLLGA